MKVLVVGATSSIAREIANCYASEGADVHLAARNTEELERTAADITLRHGRTVTFSKLDILEYDSHEPFLADAAKKLNGLDVVMLAVGDLADQKVAEQDNKIAARLIETNFTGCALFLNSVATIMERQRSGTIVAISSVAGERGRQSNYIYGSAKAGLTAFLQGLRARMFKSNVQVVTIKLGVVDTKMSYGKEGLLLPVTPAVAARGIIGAARNGGDAVFVPWFWQFIMLIIKCIPEPVFKRLKL